MKNFLLVRHEFLDRKKTVWFLSAFFIAVFVFGIFFVANTNSAKGENALDKPQPAQNAIGGEWVAKIKSSEPGKITLTFMRSGAKEGIRQAGDTYFLTEFEGLTPEVASSPAAKTKATFRLAREAGTFVCEGYFSYGKGEGVWRLSPNQSFVSAMRDRGYENLTGNDLFHAAYAKTTVKSVDDLRAAGYDRLPFSELVEAGIFKVNSEFIGRWRSAGFNNLSFGELTELGTFKVTPEFLNEIKEEGFPQITPGEALELKRLGIDGEFIRRVRAEGFPNLTIDEVINLRVHKIVK